MFSQDTKNMYLSVDNSDHLTTTYAKFRSPNHSRLRSLVQKAFYTEDDCTIRRKNSENSR